MFLHAIMIISTHTVPSQVTIHFTSQGQQSYAKAGAIAEEVLSSVKTVVAFGGEHREANRCVCD